MHTELQNRIKKRLTHLKKWAKRKNISCFRVYERELTNYPFIIDYLDGDVVIWVHEHKNNPDEIITSLESVFGISKKNIHIKYRGKQQGLQSQYEKLSQASQTKTVMEGGLKFELNLSDYLDVGLFLDHRQTREIFRQLSKRKYVLNLFAYTGSFTCYAIDGGAKQTTTIDLSKTYTQWAENNLRLNNFPANDSHELLSGDCLKLLHTLPYQQKYDLIICDPPTFSNSKKMKTNFAVDRDYPELLDLCVKRLSTRGSIIFSTNSRGFKMDADSLKDSLFIDEITTYTVPEDFKNFRCHRAWLLSNDEGAHERKMEIIKTHRAS